MALYKVYGNELVDARTEIEMTVEGKISDLDQVVTELTPKHLGWGDEGEPTPFLEIGINKPLTVEIRHIYTGQYPRSILGIGNDMLITSAIKSISTFNAAPRAINYLRTGQEKNGNIRALPANEQGTPLIFYSPALTEDNTVLTVEFIFDSFPDDLVAGIGDAFIAAAGIPIFADKSVPLLAAGTVIKLAARLTEKLVDGQPAFSVTEPLSFLRPGDNRPQQGFHLMTEDDFDLIGEGCEFNPDTGEVIYKNGGKSYDGPHPYVIFSLDGTQVEKYSQFQATAASAALLKRFYHLGDGQQQPIDTLLEAVKLYNDWQYRNKADKANKELKSLKEGTEAYKKKKAEYDAYLANIMNDLLQPE
jgi:hypothetical protein